MLNPLYELKRKLDDDSIPLPKRFCLAKNVIQTHYFPVAPKERIISEWLIGINKNNQLSAKELKNILNWLHLVEDPTSELKSGVIKILTQYIQNTHFNLSEFTLFLTFLENANIKTQFDAHISDFLTIINTLLKYLNEKELTIDIGNAKKKLLTYIKNCYKDSKRKLEFIIKLMSGDCIETVFSCFHSENIREYVLDVCRTILFPPSKKQFYASFLQTLIKEGNIDNLIVEKGDNIQSVIKIMSAFFTFPNGRTSKELDFLSRFIDVFVSCYRDESRLIFMFYIMAVNSLNMQQNYISPAMIVPPICIGDNSDKLKRNLFLNMVNYLIENEVGIDVSLTETFGEKSSRVDVKKNFMAFLQTVMLGQIKLDGKIDKLTIQILKSSLRLDPMLIEQKMDQIIPTVMCAKKNNHTAELYADMLEYLLDVLFKLSRGMLFINQMLPHIKIVLEASNTDQFELKQKIEECERSGQSCDKMVTKIIRGEDLFPKTCVERFGRLTCELMFRQNADLLLSLQRDFEEQCIYMLEEGFVSPSIITITEVMSAILSSMLDHSKMADHTVPELIAQEFWKTFDGFQKEFLKKFGECVLKLNYNPQLTLAFLKLSLSIAQLKILNHKYASVKAGFFVYGKSVNVFDLSLVLPCLNADQWAIMAGRAQELEAAAVLNNLLLLKIIVMELLDNENRNGDKNDVDIDVVKEHLIKECLKNDCLLDGDTYFSKTLLVNLNKKQMKQIAKGICKILLDDPAMSTIKNEAILNNKQLLLAFVMEVLKRLVQFLEEPIVTEEYPSLSKCIVKTNFLLEKFLKEIDFDGYIKSLTNPKDFTDGDIFLIVKCLEILKQLKIQHLGENCQLSVVFVLLSLKKACGNKKVRKNVDNILQMSFELSSCCPDLYKIYPLDYIFDLDSEFLSLITLSSKINGTLIIKSLLEMTVKKVKTDSEIIKKVVKILLSKQKHKKESNIECFGDNVFQIICMILPIISKEKKSITTSTHRSVLADLQEKLHKSLLKSFKNIEFSNDIIQSYEDLDMATPNAIEAYTLTLSKYCESTDAEAVKDLVCLWSGLEYFAGIAMSSLENAESKLHHVGASIQLLNIALRHIKKLETHSLFQNKDEAFSKIWHCLKKRLHIIFSEKNAKYKHANDHCLEEMAVTVKFLCELSSVDCFRLKFVEDLYSMMVLKKASSIEREVDKLNSTLTIHLAAKKLWRYCLKSNITAPKCAAISKQMYRTCKNQVIWIRNNYDIDNIIFKENVDNDDDDKLMTQKTDGIRRNENSIKISDVVCEIIKTDVDSLCEVILASKKILLDYKFIDAVFELQQMLHFMLGLDGNRVVCDISWKSFFIIFEGSVSLLNALVLAREELLEDRWPCFLQNYRMLVLNLCKKSSSTIQLDRSIEDKLAEISHTIEKLTYSLCKKKNQISRLAAYVVADICYQIEKYIPPKHIRQHLENSVVLLIQVADSTHAMAFLRRALAGNPGQMTMTNLYTMYKRYHKYVGNS